ncbi:hypothetical protein PSN45_004967 [Yamadazyma tenuis]|uniref:Uncharacterized protein n=1 Tax=Candida tenuis (strain ATCC 10573 / BCRC 21748 / CBS 615 / JCM 9827 / NBRC 10315 / NRRL Y-1498 / VKM Y-70) TaxID=590646 RepID=G3B2B0_CANTC|nr:uncharacterized protein CANTEDRAFT_133951 [Yamadazyma tenuis ATCC 10573]EGV64634.1 hypothetical protein CANTEDRAFT_133951 [Yamadazyma tenuis ATCC 10573]WEJ97416.1 hypothetical protein PSN45_004967 [Yamadazyma tenuis]
MNNWQTVSIVLACFLGIFLITVVFFLIYLGCHFSIILESKRYPFTKYEYNRPLDLESGLNSSIIATKSVHTLPTSHVTEEGDIIVRTGFVVGTASHGDLGSLSEFQDSNSFNTDSPISNQVSNFSICHTPSDLRERENTGSQAEVNSTDLGVPAGKLDRYDSFSKSLIIKDLMQGSPSEQPSEIREVSDPYSSNSISVGEVVVVVQSFKGDNAHEFSHLQEGDLLRVVRFYLKEGTGTLGKKGLHLLKITGKKHKFLWSFSPEPSYEDLTYISKDDPEFPLVHCTGIILNTFLEYDASNNTMALKMKDSNHLDTDILKDFPLKCVSLETTVVSHSGQ